MKRLPLIIALALITVFAVYFSWFSLGRHWKLNSGRFDLGNMEQVVWNVVHGHGFVMTDPYGVAQVSRLAFHTDFFLLLVAPIYAVVPSTETLLLLQALAVASGGLAAFFVAKKVLGQAWWGTLFAAVYLFMPGVQWATSFDFHPVTFVPPLILWAVWAMLAKRYWWMLGLVVAALLAKEEVGLLLPAIGLYLWIIRRDRRWGPALTFGPLAWSLVMFLVVLPHFRLTTEADAEVYRSVFGTGTTSIISGALHRPLTFLHILVSHQNLIYLKQLLLSSGAISFFSLWWLAAVPEYLINALSLKPAQHLLISHYTSGLTPWLLLSAAWGTAWVRRRLNRKFPGRRWPTTGLIVIVLASVGFSSWSWSPLPGTPHDQTFVVTWKHPYAHDVRQWAQIIPSMAKVSATNDIGSQFAARQYLYSFPLGVNLSNYVVVLENHATPVVATDAQVTAAVTQLRADPHWQVLEQQGDLTILRRRE